MNKKAQLGKKVEAGAIIIITVVILFLIYSQLVPEAQTAGNKLNVSNRCVDVGCSYNFSKVAEGGVACAVNSTNEGNATSCGDPLSKGFPLSSLFRSGGVIFLGIMVVLLLIILKTVIPKSKK